MKKYLNPGDTITWKIKKKSIYPKLIYLALFCLAVYWFSIGFKPKQYPILPPQTTVFEIPKPIEVQQDVHACRDEVTEDRQYGSNGLPLNREYLTSFEWKGRHLSDSSLAMRKKFKDWKKGHIETFLSWIIQAAKEEEKISGIPYQIVVSQAMLESQYSTSRLSVEANNLFGVKHRGKGNDYIVAKDDSPTDRFKTYPKGKWWSIRHHSNILNKRYRSRIKGKPTMDKWVNCLCCDDPPCSVEKSSKFVEAGGQVYATSCFNGKESYSQKLLRIIKSLKL
tara:strand:+ start:1469 stop:2308 length:840 start_codon:yes stop_codon:yes gene_type:complete